MKGIVISADKSGSGKTTITLGLMKSLMNKNFKVQGYKVGPDYIDTGFHTRITKKASRNLDIFLMGEDGVKASFTRGSGDIKIIEGAMGLYDGKGINSKYSTAHISKLLDLPIVLILSPKGQMATLCAEINGLKSFEDVKIAGVILNNINEGYYKTLKIAIEKNCNLNVYGYVPKDDRLSLESRHLGLIQNNEIKDIDEKIDICASLIDKYVDLNKLINDMGNCKNYKDDFHKENKNINIGIAYDKAFNFYYKENLELLGELGNIKYFSPLKDKELPKDLDFLYLGGGYPEVFIDEVSENISMLKSIKESLENGLKCYAECGGLMYLTKGLSSSEVDSLNSDVKLKNMVGFFNGICYMTNRLQNFGYAEFKVNSQNSIMNANEKINCHVFHKSKTLCNEKTIYDVRKETVLGNIKEWKCGYYKKNTLASYAHVHFFGNMNLFK